MEDFATIGDKIRKLLSLSASSNPNEAAIALHKAHELLSKYNLDINKIQKEVKEQISDIIEEPVIEGSRARTWRLHLLQEIAQYNYCDIYRTVFNNPVVNVRKASAYYISIVGKKHNIIGCKILAEYIFNAIEHQAKIEMKGKGRLAVESFKVGFAFAIKERLQILRTVELNKEECKSLIILENVDINNFFTKKKTSMAVSIVTAKDIVGYTLGKEKGKALSLDQQIEQMEENLQIEK